MLNKQGSPDLSSSGSEIVTHEQYVIIEHDVSEENQQEIHVEVHQQVRCFLELENCQVFLLEERLNELRTLVSSAAVEGSQSGTWHFVCCFPLS